MAIYLSNRQKALPIRSGLLRRRLIKILKELSLAEAELSVSLVTDKDIRQLNRDYRGQDRTTNVLSFPLQEEGVNPRPKKTPEALGDIVVSTETIIREAVRHGYTTGGMLYFYLIHGLTHLLGYNHEKDFEAAARQEAETERLWNLIDHSI